MSNCCNGTCPMYDAENGECCATDEPRVSVKPDAECFFDAYGRDNPYIPPKPTNADRIRSMSDEELHKFLLDFGAGYIDYAKTFCDLCCKDAALERRSTDCDGCLLWWLKNDATLPQGIDWLKQPVKEEHNETD